MRRDEIMLDTSRTPSDNNAMPRGIKSQRITFRATQSFRTELEKAAREDQRKLSDWIQLKLTAILTERQQSPKEQEVA